MVGYDYGLFTVRQFFDEDDVTAFLSFFFEAYLLQGFDYLTP